MAEQRQRNAVLSERLQSSTALAKEREIALEAKVESTKKALDAERESATGARSECEAVTAKLTEEQGRLEVARAAELPATMPSKSSGKRWAISRPWRPPVEQPFQ